MGAWVVINAGWYKASAYFAQAGLHKIAPRRARSVAEEVLGTHRPEVWVSDRYAGQQERSKEHQICLAHVLRDVQYATMR